MSFQTKNELLQLINTLTIMQLSTGHNANVAYDQGNVSKAKEWDDLCGEIETEVERALDTIPYDPSLN